MAALLLFFFVFTVNYYFSAWCGAFVRGTGYFNIINSKKRDNIIAVVCACRLAIANAVGRDTEVDGE